MRRVLSLNSYLNFYSQIDKQPNFISFLMILPRIIFSKNIFKSFNLIRRMYKVNRLQADPPFINSKTLPKINVLIVIERKDFPLLQFTIKSLIANSLNPVSRIFIVTPNRQVPECEKLISEIKLSQSYQIQIIPENLIIDSKIRKKLRIEFIERYGWILQQFITVNFILEQKWSGETPILALDGDTIVTRPTSWIDDNGNQILLQSIEYHRPYYELIKKLDSKLCKDKLSFVTHHMVYLPSRFRDIYSKLGIMNLDQLAQFVIDNYDKSQKSSVCVEFEIYAQYLFLNYKEKISVLKFANISVSREDFLLKSEFKDDFWEDYSKYKSISLHSYLD